MDNTLTVGPEEYSTNHHSETLCADLSIPLPRSLSLALVKVEGPLSHNAGHNLLRVRNQFPFNKLLQTQTTRSNKLEKREKSHILSLV